jgi:hypothetical protein
MAACLPCPARGLGRMYAGAALLTLCVRFCGTTRRIMPSYIGQRIDSGHAGIWLKGQPRKRRRKPRGTSRRYKQCPCCGLVLKYKRRCIDALEL